MRGFLNTIARWLYRKTMPSSLTGMQWSGTSYVDAFKRTREPRPNELLAELKGVAWACASLNAAVCASYPPRLYVITRHNQPQPKCATRPVRAKTLQRLCSASHLAVRTKGAETVEEVTDHPLLTLLARPNLYLSAYDLLELTALYLEVHGCGYWFLERDVLGTPTGAWVLPSQNVTPKREPDSVNPVDYYSYRTGAKEQRFAPTNVVAFRFPDPRDPYTGGLSPLRACYEQVVLSSEYAATKSAVYEQRAVPSALVSPDEVLGEEERDRLEAQWNQKFRRGGAGRVVVAESALKVQLLQQSMGDLAALADMKATKEDIANAFHVPIAFFTTQTNLANLQASQSQHIQQAIGPRLQRRDETLNSFLVPAFDPTGRLFLASEDPVPADQDADMAQEGQDLKYGVLSVNEVRSGRGLPPAAWGQVPWLPSLWLPTDQPRAKNGGDAAGADTARS